MRLHLWISLSLALSTACGVNAHVEQKHSGVSAGQGPSGGSCLIDDGADCNLVTQCGCASGEQCQALGEAARPSCVKSKSGQVARDSACKVASQCPAGQTCDRGSCREYCASDADCTGGKCVPAGDANGKNIDRVKVCWKACTASDEKACATGTACRSVKTPAGQTGTFCVAPLDPCPTTEDGTCDDQSGTKTCADGTDAKDCNCKPKLRGATCDPLAQCGCARGSTCEAQTLDTNRSDDNTITLTAVCGRAGTNKLNEPCVASDDCQPGLFCHQRFKLCTAYCNTDDGCDAGCLPLRNPDDSKLGVCLNQCDRASKTPCPEGVSCIVFDKSHGGVSPPNTSICFEPLEMDCPRQGVCDEPQGTGICAAGTDKADCCKPPTADGVCNPVKQCGCEDQPNTQCQHTGRSARTTCEPKGTQAPWSRCTAQRGQCPPGYHCADDVCRPYCQTMEDCGPGTFCSVIPEMPGVGACFVACDFEAQENNCPIGTVCQRVFGSSTFCGIIDEDCDAFWIGDGKCDDTRPGGTRICAMGTDPDCN